MNARTRMIAFGAMAFAGTATAVFALYAWRCSRTSHVGESLEKRFVQTTASTIATRNIVTVPRRPGRSFAEAQNQWPENGRERAQAMHERLERVTKTINRACGTELLIMLGETGRGGQATGTGIVRIDFTLLWRLSEDGLAVLIAHEFAHELLGHSHDLAMLHRLPARRPARMQQLRELERQADAMAGRILARTEYSPRAFTELLAPAMDTEWCDPQIRTYYPNQDRLDTLLEAYAGQGAGNASEGDGLK